MSTTPDPDDVHYHLQAAINRLKQAISHARVPLAGLTDDWVRLVGDGEAGPHMAALERKLDLVLDALRSMTEARAALEDLATHI